jgi:hypothetical protein
VKVLVDPSGTRLARARPPVRAFLGFALLAVAALLLQRASAGLLAPSEVELHYLGAAVGEGLPRAALWEELHAGAFLYGFVLFMLGALLPLCRLRPAARSTLFPASVAAALADLAAPFLVVALGGGGALRVATTALVGVVLPATIVAVFATFGPGAVGPAERADG